MGSDKLVRGKYYCIVVFKRGCQWGRSSCPYYLSGRTFDHKRIGAGRDHPFISLPGCVWSASRPSCMGRCGNCSLRRMILLRLLPFHFKLPRLSRRKAPHTHTPTRTHTKRKTPPAGLSTSYKLLFSARTTPIVRSLSWSVARPNDSQRHVSSFQPPIIIHERESAYCHVAPR
jgi:hypothetical protein